MKPSLAWILLPVATMAADLLPQRAEPTRLISGIVASQLGYQPEERKVGVLLLDPAAAAPTGAFSLETTSGTKVFEGKLASWGKSWERNAWLLDFSKYKTSGQYRLRVGDQISLPVPIDAHPWRSAMKLDQVFRRILARQRMTQAEYPDYKALPTFSQDANGKLTQLGATWNVSGGWQDAHSDDQHTQHASFVLNLMIAWDNDSDWYRAAGADVLVKDEARWGAEWLLRLQGPEGWFANGLTSTRYNNSLPLRGVTLGKSAGLAGLSAAALARVAISEKNRDAGFSEKCREAAIDAWKWETTHASDAVSDPDYWNAYYDGHVIAAYQLWRMHKTLGLAGAQVYADSLNAAILRGSMTADGGWRSGTNLGDFGGYWGPQTFMKFDQTGPAMLAWYPDAPANVQAKIRNSWNIHRDAWKTREKANPYGMLDMSLISWFGSSANILAGGYGLVYAGRVLQDTAMDRMGRAQLHILLGNNPMGRSYLRGVGSDWWRGDWASDTASTYGAILPGMIETPLPNGQKIPSDNCGLTGDMGSTGWRCGEWCTNYTFTMLAATAIMDAGMGATTRVSEPATRMRSAHPKGVGVTPDQGRLRLNIPGREHFSIQGATRP